MHPLISIGDPQVQADVHTEIRSLKPTSGGGQGTLSKISKRAGGSHSSPNSRTALPHCGPSSFSHVHLSLLFTIHR